MGRAQIVVALLFAAAVALFAQAPFQIDQAPYESTMGLIQKIFYFHVPAAMTMFVSAFVCGIASAIYMLRRRRMADHVALAAAELVVLFGLIVLVTGPMWARKAWGVWWQWDARLTMTLVMWMLFVGYLMLRRFGGPGSEALAATVGVFGMALVPFIYWSVNVWRTIHPLTTVVPNLVAGMMGPFVWCIGAFLSLYGLLLAARVRLEAARARLEDAYAALED
jgi:heme exporter protein C